MRTQWVEFLNVSKNIYLKMVDSKLLLNYKLAKCKKILGGIYHAIIRLHSCKSKNGTLYTGVTSDLIKRIYQHKSKVIPGFTTKYNVMMLVYYEIHSEITEAIKKRKAH